MTERDIDTGDLTLFLKCWGERVPGESTVLLVSGLGPTLSYWETMAAAFAADGHHVCAYDRAGVGRSQSPSDESRTTDDQVADLVGLLDGADLAEPVVVVAHSLGVLPALGLVDHAPARVAGVVLVDPWAPRESSASRAALPPEKPNEPAAVAQERAFLEDFLFDPAQNPEHLLLATCDEQAVHLLDRPGPAFGDLPVVVLEAPFPSRPRGIPVGYHRAARTAHLDGHAELAAESTNGTLVEVRDTGHDIMVDRPRAVTDAILAVLAG